MPADALLDFAGERADLPLQLAPSASSRRLERERLDARLRDLELPLVPVLAAIERAGIRVDVAALAATVDADRTRARRR